MRSTMPISMPPCRDAAVLSAVAAVAVVAMEAMVVLVVEVIVAVEEAAAEGQEDPPHHPFQRPSGRRCSVPSFPTRF